MLECELRCWSNNEQWMLFTLPGWHYTFTSSFICHFFFVCLLVNYKVFSQERNLTLETVFLAENYFWHLYEIYLFETWWPVTFSSLTVNDLTFTRLMTMSSFKKKNCWVVSEAWTNDDFLIVCPPWRKYRPVTTHTHTHSLSVGTGKMSQQRQKKKKT